MTTYVTINGADGKFSTIAEAISKAEELGFETVTLKICDESGKSIETQTCKKGESGEIVFATWRIAGYKQWGYCAGMVSPTAICSEFNSKAEAKEAAEQYKDQFNEYDFVSVELLERTLTAISEELQDGEIIYRNGEDIY